MVDILTLKVQSGAVAAVELHTALIRGAKSVELPSWKVVCGQNLLSRFGKAN
jgi:hypothetical protein